MKIILFLLFIINHCNFFSQDNYNPEFLIPYNDNGKWGWCDTLGKIKIKTEYSKTSFLEKNQNIFHTKVSKDKNEYVYIYGSGLISIPNVSIEFLTGQFLLPENQVILKTNSDKYILFNYQSKKTLLDSSMNIEKIEWFSSDHLLFKIKDGQFCFYDLNLNKISKTKMNYRVFSEITGNKYYKEGKNSSIWFELTEERKFIKTDDIKGENPEKTTDAELYRILSPKRKLLVSESKELCQKFRTTDLSNKFIGLNKTPINSVLVYNTEYIVYIENNQYGVYNYTIKKEVLPANYDFIFIDFQNGNLFLKQDKYMGVLLLNTIKIPTLINSEYDFISTKSIGSNEKKFSIFEVIKDGQVYYYGSNGYRYFNIN